MPGQPRTSRLSLTLRNTLAPGRVKSALGNLASGARMLSCFRPDRTLKPILAAVFMGAVVALSLLWTQAGIHVSGVFSLLCPAAAVPAVQAPNALSCSIHSAAADKGWIAWMVCGIFAGAFVTSF